MWWNFTGSCLQCNGSKGSVSLLEFLMKRSKNGGRFVGTRRGKDNPRFGKKRIPIDESCFNLPERWYDPLGLQEMRREARNAL
jgi:hypothetical protein